MRSKTVTSLLAALAIAIGLSAFAPTAHAGLFADFIEPGGGNFPNDFAFTNTHSPSHATLDSTGTVNVLFRYVGIASLPTTYQNALLTMSAAILGTDHASNSGFPLHQDTQRVDHGSISITLASPATEGGHTGTNLLTVSFFSSAFLVGTDHGNSVDLDSQIGSPDVVFTSDFITNFSPADEAFALHFLLGNNGTLTIDNVNQLLRSFVASGTGQFFDTLAPEPTSIALMLIGLVMAIAVARKQSFGTEPSAA